MNPDFNDDPNGFLFQNSAVAAGQITLDDILAAEQILFGEENIPDWQEI